MDSIVKRYRHPWLFFAIATIVPWGCWLGAGAISRQEPFSDDNLRLASILAGIGLLAPFLAALALTLREPELRRDVASRIFTLKGVTPFYGAVALLLMLASILAAQAISLLFGYSADQFAITGHFSFSSGVFPVWFLLVAAPVIEELAWHAYGTDALRSRFSLLVTCLIFASYWAVWHMPLASIRDYYQSNLVEGGALYSINFLVSVFPFVILMNWLYYKTGRNILIACVFHITAGYFNELFATHPDSKVIQTVLLTILAVVVVWRDRDFFLTRDYRGA